MYACESLFKNPHTNEFVGKRFFALEAALPSFGPKWGRWVYEKAKVPKAERQLESPLSQPLRLSLRTSTR